MKKILPVVVTMLAIAVLAVVVKNYMDVHKPVMSPTAEAAPIVPTGVVSLEPFVVNLADETGSRFLRVTMSLVVEDEDKAALFTEDEVAVMRTRTAILDLLASKKAPELATPEGKTALKQKIAQAVAYARRNDGYHMPVHDVLFSEFIVQF